MSFTVSARVLWILTSFFANIIGHTSVPYTGSTLVVTAKFRNQVRSARAMETEAVSNDCLLGPVTLKKRSSMKLKNRMMMKMKSLSSFLDEEKEKYGEEDNEIIIFRQHWERRYADSYGSFESTSKSIKLSLITSQIFNNIAYIDLFS